MSEFRVGQKVELQDGRIARVHFIGNALFAAGEWLGVELEDASGKNDGSVQGQRYFDCKPGHGMFVRPAAVAIVLEQPIPKPNRAAVARGDSAAVKSRPQSLTAPGLKKQNILDSGSVRRQSINAGSPTPARRGAPPSRLGVGLIMGRLVVVEFRLTISSPLQSHPRSRMLRPPPLRAKRPLRAFQIRPSKSLLLQAVSPSVPQWVHLPRYRQIDDFHANQFPERWLGPRRFLAHCPRYHLIPPQKTFRFDQAQPKSSALPALIVHSAQVAASALPQRALSLVYCPPRLLRVKTSPLEGRPQHFLGHPPPLVTLPEVGRRHHRLNVDRQQVPRHLGKLRI